MSVLKLLAALGGSHDEVKHKLPTYGHPQAMTWRWFKLHLFDVYTSTQS